MRAKSKLSKHRQDLAVKYRPLVGILAGYFLQHRPKWQRDNLRDDLEGEGYLALCKAARTYDKARLAYPKAYFALAVLNAMYKWIRRGNREPDGDRIPMEVAEELVGTEDEMDHLRMAIEMLAPEQQTFAADRFEEGMTLRSLSEEHGVPLKRASLRARSLAHEIADLLDIRLPEPKADP